MKNNNISGPSLPHPNHPCFIHINTPALQNTHWQMAYAKTEREHKLCVFVFIFFTLHIAAALKKVQPDLQCY